MNGQITVKKRSQKDICSLATNGLRLGEVAEYGKININFKQNIMRNENVNKPQNQQSCQDAVSDSAVVEDKIFYDGKGGWEKQSYRDAMKNFQEKFHNEFFHR